MLCGHIRAHNNLPGPLDDGNESADKLIKMTSWSQVELAKQLYMPFIIRLAEM